MKTIPSQLPVNWTWTTMGEIADVVGGGTPRTTDERNYEGGTIPWITPADLSSYTPKHISRGERFITQKGLSESSARMLPAGTVLFSSRAPVGYVAIASNPVCTNQGFKSFVLKSEDILSDYVYWWLKGSKDLAESLASGTTFLELSGAKAKQIPIPIAPLEQQRRIVAEIEKQFSRLDEAVASLKRTKANLKRYKTAVLKAAVEGKLTEDWRKQHPDVEPAGKLLERILAERRAKWRGKGRYKEPAGPDSADLPSLPKGWAWATVEQLASGLPGPIQSGPFGSHLLHSEFVEQGVLAIGIDNILDDKFSLGSQHRITPKKFEVLRKFEARPRDVVITVMATVGRVCVLPQNLERAIITKHCYRITPAGEAVDSDYLAIALRAESSTRQHIFGNARGQTRPGINGPILKAAPVALPPPREQQQIVAEVERRLSVIDELETTVEANLTRADRLRQSILGRAFRGAL